MLIHKYSPCFFSHEVLEDWCWQSTWEYCETSEYPFGKSLSIKYYLNSITILKKVWKIGEKVTCSCTTYNHCQFYGAGLFLPCAYDFCRCNQIMCTILYLALFTYFIGIYLHFTSLQSFLIFHNLILHNLLTQFSFLDHLSHCKLLYSIVIVTVRSEVHACPNINLHSTQTIFVWLSQFILVV